MEPPRWRWPVVVAAWVGFIALVLAATLLGIFFGVWFVAEVGEILWA